MPLIRRRWSRAGWLLLLNGPINPAVLVLVLYMLWLGILLPYSHEARDFIHVESAFIQRGHGSSLIKVDAYVARQPTSAGFDGQFYYDLALDPLHAAPYLDLPVYRYTRIVYPLAARLLALGQPHAIPYTLLLINWLALGGGTLAVAAWLRRRALPVWFALLYGLYPGLLVGVNLDLAEPLCFALVALAVYLFDFGGRRRLVWSGIAFGLAGLTRETSLVFPIVYALGLLGAGGKERDRMQDSAIGWRGAALLLGLAVGPFLLYKGALWLWLGSLGLFVSDNVALVPFSGIAAHYPWQSGQVEEIRSVFFPSLICGGMALWAVYRRSWSSEVWSLLANILFFVVLLGPWPAVDFADAGRLTTGVVLAALYCLPHFDSLTGKNHWWLWSSGALWLSLMPFWLLVPIADSFLHSHP